MIWSLCHDPMVLVGATLAVLLSGADAQSKLATDFDVQPFLANPARVAIEQGGPFAFARANAICERATQRPPLPDVPFFRPAGWRARCVDHLISRRLAAGKTAARLVCEVRYIDAEMLADFQSHPNSDVRRFLASCEREFRAGQQNSPAAPAPPRPTPVVPKAPVNQPTEVATSPAASPAALPNTAAKATDRDTWALLILLLFPLVLGFIRLCMRAGWHRCWPTNLS